MAAGAGGAAKPGAPPRPQPIGKPRLLIGEGREEVFFFEALLRHLNRDDIAVEQYGGKANLRRYLRTVARSPDFPLLRSLGVTRDADDDPAGAMQSVTGALSAAGLTTTQASPGPLAVRVFILPAPGQPGMLEDLCWEAVLGDRAAPCVDEFLACVKRAGREPQPLAKAQIHAWLASKERPDLRLGEAAGQGYWPFDHGAFDAISAFIRSL